MRLEICLMNDFLLEVPLRPDDTTSEKGYDYKSLLSPVLEIEEANEACDWAKQGIVEAMPDLGEARRFVVMALNAM